MQEDVYQKIAKANETISECEKNINSCLDYFFIQPFLNDAMPIHYEWTSERAS